METNRQYDLMVKAADEGLLQRDPASLAEMTGFAWDGKRLTAKTLGTCISISWADWQISPKLDMWHELTILQYLANAKGAAPTERFISLGEFHSGSLARAASFDLENEAIIRRIGDAPADELRKAAANLGGVELEDRADLSFVFDFLPNIRIKLNLWLADEEFPATGKVLFDACAQIDLQVEAAGTAASILLSLLEKGL